MKRKISFVLLCFFIIQSSQIAFAQNPKPEQKVDAEFLKKVEIIIAERDKFKSTSEAQAEQISAQLDQINALRALLQIQKTISGEWQTAAEARKSALAIDDKLLAKYDQEVLRLRGERDSARSRHKWYAAGGFIFGALLTGYVRGRN